MPAEAQLRWAMTQPFALTTSVPVKPGHRASPQAQPAARAVPPGVLAMLIEAWRSLCWSLHSRLRQRRALSDLDDHLRRDVGLPPRLPPPPLDVWLRLRLPGG